MLPIRSTGGLHGLPQELLDGIKHELTGRDLVAFAMLDKSMLHRSGLSLPRARTASALLEDWRQLGRPAFAMAMGGESFRIVLRDGGRHLDPAAIDRAIDDVLAGIGTDLWARCRALVVDARALDGVVPGFIGRLAMRLAHVRQRHVRAVVIAALLREYHDVPNMPGRVHPLRPLVDWVATEPASFLQSVIQLTGLGSPYLAGTVQAFELQALRSAVGMLLARIFADPDATDGAAASAVDEDCIFLVRALVDEMAHPHFRGSAAEPLVLAALRRVYAARDAMMPREAGELDEGLREFGGMPRLKRAMWQEEVEEWAHHFPGV